MTEIDFETRIVMALAFESRRMARAAKKVKALIKVLESEHGVRVAPREVEKQSIDLVK